MFWGGGYLYVYFTYGMHFCANVVTGTRESGEAVLIRAIEPMKGTATMMKNRFGGRSAANAGQNLCNGPAKLCKALSIRRRHNGTDLLGDEIYLLNAPGIESKRIGRSKRVGITRGTDNMWRFTIKGNDWVSR